MALLEVASAGEVHRTVAAANAATTYDVDIMFGLCLICQYLLDVENGLLSLYLEGSGQIEQVKIPKCLLARTANGTTLSWFDDE